VRLTGSSDGTIELQSGDLVLRAREILLQQEADLRSVVSAITAMGEVEVTSQTTEQARQAELERARRIDLEAAMRDYERLRKLAEVGLAPPSQVRDLERHIAQLRAGGDLEKQRLIELEHDLKELQDARRRFEVGLLSERQLAEFEQAVARQQAAETGERNRVELDAARRDLEQVKQLVDKGLLSRDAVRDKQARLAAVEEMAARLDQEKLKVVDMEQKKMLEIVEKIQKQDVMKSETERRVKDLIVQYEKAQSDYQKKLADVQIRKDALQKLEARKERLVDVSSNRPIETGDVLMITIAGETALPTVYRIASDGTIRVPLLGSFKVVGETPERVRDAIGRKLAESRLGSAGSVSVRLRRPE
jgi:hypothetical protein